MAFENPSPSCFPSPRVHDGCRNLVNRLAKNAGQGWEGHPERGNSFGGLRGRDGAGLQRLVEEGFEEADSVLTDRRLGLFEDASDAIAYHIEVMHQQNLTRQTRATA